MTCSGWPKGPKGGGAGAWREEAARPNIFHPATRTVTPVNTLYNEGLQAEAGRLRVLALQAGRCLIMPLAAGRLVITILPEGRLWIDTVLRHTL